MPEISRREFVTVLGGGAVVSTAAVGALAAGWGNVARVTTRGRGRWTRFGTVAVLGASRQHLSAGNGHHQQAVSNVPAKHRTWSETVRVDVEVHNGSDQPILVSPGQFRLRLGAGGMTVTPYDAGWSVGPLGASETVASWITYLAPPGGADLWIEYAEPGATAPQAFAVDPVVSS